MSNLKKNITISLVIMLVLGMFSAAFGQLDTVKINQYRDQIQGISWGGVGTDWAGNTQPPPATGAFIPFDDWQGFIEIEDNVFDGSWFCNATSRNGTFVCYEISAGEGPHGVEITYGGYWFETINNAPVQVDTCFATFYETGGDSGHECEGVWLYPGPTGPNTYWLGNRN